MADLRDLLYGLCNKYPEGLTQTRIRGELTGNGVDSKQITLALNALIDSGDLRVLQRKQADGTTEVLFRAVQREDREKFRGLSSEDMLVYQQIKASKDHGIWVCNLSFLLHRLSHSLSFLTLSLYVFFVLFCCNTSFSFFLSLS